jgi:hypothetical protein
MNFVNLLDLGILKNCFIIGGNLNNKNTDWLNKDINPKGRKLHD